MGGEDSRGWGRGGKATLATVWRYVLALHSDAGAGVVLRQLGAATRDGSRQEDIMNAAEELREQGAIRGTRRTLLKQLKLRFGTVPEGAVARLHDADEAQLDTWIERVMTAGTLDEIFAD